MQRVCYQGGFVIVVSLVCSILYKFCSGFLSKRSLVIIVWYGVHFTLQHACTCVHACMRACACACACVCVCQCAAFVCLDVDALHVDLTELERQAHPYHLDFDSP